MTQILANLITVAVTLLTFYLGYHLGQKAALQEPISLKFPKIFKKKTKIGAIPKLTQTQIEKKGTRLEETEDAMTKTLDELGLK